MPRKFEVEQERDELLAKLQEAHAILGEALGVEDENESDDDDDADFEEEPEGEDSV